MNFQSKQVKNLGKVTGVLAVIPTCHLLFTNPKPYRLSHIAHLVIVMIIIAIVVIILGIFLHTFIIHNPK